MADNRFGSLITHIIAGAVGAGIVLGVQNFMPANEGTDAGDEFGTSVREFLKANPDAVVDAIKQYQANEQKKQLDEAKKTIVENKATIYNSPNSPVVGNPNGDVTLVEFFDYNCHYCRGVAPDVAKLLADDPKIKLVHKHLPILGPSSVEATKVALAVRMQNPAAYEAISKNFLAHDGALSAADIEKAARDAGADWNKVLVDKESDAVKAEIKANYDLAQKLGLNGTPGFIVGDNLLPGAQSEAQLQDAVKAARAMNASAPAATTSEATPPTAPAPTADQTAAPARMPTPGEVANPPADEADKAPGAAAN